MKNKTNIQTITATAPTEAPIAAAAPVESPEDDEEEEAAEVGELVLRTEVDTVPLPLLLVLLIVAAVDVSAVPVLLGDCQDNRSDSCQASVARFHCKCAYWYVHSRVIGVVNSAQTREVIMLAFLATRDV